MELGQTVCLPSAPRCSACPLRSMCQAYSGGKPESYPTPRPRRAAELHHLASAVISRDNKVVMVRGLDDGLLGDLWNFPSAFGTSGADARSRLAGKLRTLLPGTLQFRPPIGELRHGITFRTIQVALHPVQFSGRGVNGTARWFPLARLGSAAVSQLARKIAQRIQEE